MADAPKLNGTDTLRQAYPKFNQAIDNANEALTKSTAAESNSSSAVNTARTAEQKADSVQSQFNQVVIEGDSSVESAQARVDKDGQTSATLKDRLDKQQYFVNVKSFGATGDGVTDDTVAITNAINYVKDLGGGTVFFPSGSYYVTDSVELKGNNIHAKGNGRSTKIIGPTTTTSQGHIIGIIGTSDLERAKGCSITNMHVEANATLDNPIGISKANDVLIEGIYVPHSPWKGITAQNSCDGVTIRDCLVENCEKYGIGIEYGSTGSGIVNVIIENCISRNNGEEGFMVSGSGYVDNAKGYILRNLKAFNNVKSGVSVLSLNAPIITNIETRNNSADGVNAFRIYYGVFSNIVALDNVQNGLRIYDTGISNNVVGGVFKRNQGSGIAILTATKTLINNPDCEETTVQIRGIYVLGNNTTVQGGKFAGKTESVFVDNSVVSTFVKTDPANYDVASLAGDVAITDTGYNTVLTKTITLEYPKMISINFALNFIQGATAGNVIAYIALNGVGYVSDYASNLAANGVVTFNKSLNIKLNKGSNSFSVVVKSWSGGGTVKQNLVFDGVSKGTTRLDYILY